MTAGHAGAVVVAAAADGVVAAACGAAGAVSPAVAEAADSEAERLVQQEIEVAAVASVEPRRCAEIDPLSFHRVETSELTGQTSAVREWPIVRGSAIDRASAVPAVLAIVPTVLETGQVQADQESRIAQESEMDPGLRIVPVLQQAWEPASARALPIGQERVIGSAIAVMDWETAVTVSITAEIASTTELETAAIGSTTVATGSTIAKTFGRTSITTGITATGMGIGARGIGTTIPGRRGVSRRPRSVLRRGPQARCFTTPATTDTRTRTMCRQWPLPSIPRSTIRSRL